VDETHPVNSDIAGIAHASDIPIFRAVHRFREIIKPDQSAWQPVELRAKKVCAFCGIAKPDSFQKLLNEAEAQILSFIPFPDHYSYNRFDLEELKNIFLSLHADYLVTTEKDAMRLQSHPEFLKMICILRMEMEIKPSTQSFEKFMASRLTTLSQNG